MAELTREQAIAEHRKMWNWIADNLESMKMSVYTLKQMYCNENEWNLLNNCFLCNYCDQICEKCPLYWGEEVESSTTFCEPVDSKVYISWIKADRLSTQGDYKEAAKLSRKIANLPVKIYQNIENGNFHFTYEAMVEEIRELYDSGYDYHSSKWRKWYDVKPL